MKTTLTIEVFFDLVCPWCLIGKRHLRTALAQWAEHHPEVEVDVVWRPHILLPDTPVRGLPYQAFYLQRLGGADAVARRRAQVREAGQRAGIEFDFDRIAVLPNTEAAHQLILFAAAHGDAAQQDALIEQLFLAFFTQGEDIGDPVVLARLAALRGFDPSEVAHYLRSDEADTVLRQQLLAAHQRGVAGVPCFVFDNRFPVSGAHPPESLLEAMRLALRIPSTSTPI